LCLTRFNDSCNPKTAERPSPSPRMSIRRAPTTTAMPAASALAVGRRRTLHEVLEAGRRAAEAAPPTGAGFGFMQDNIDPSPIDPSGEKPGTKPRFTDDTVGSAVVARQRQSQKMIALKAKIVEAQAKGKTDEVERLKEEYSRLTHALTYKY